MALLSLNVLRRTLSPRGLIILLCFLAGETAAAKVGASGFLWNRPSEKAVLTLLAVMSDAESLEALDILQAGERWGRIL